MYKFNKLSKNQLSKNQYYYNYITKCFVLFCGFFIIAIQILNGFPKSEKNYIAAAVMILSMYLVWYVRKNSELVFVFLVILYSNYSICYSSYLNIIKGTMYVGFVNDYVSTIGINILFVFLFFLLLFMPNEINNSPERKNTIYNYNYNKFILFGIYILLAYIFAFGFKRPEKLGERGTPYPIYEYSIILFILGFYFSGNIKFHIRLLSLFIIVFSFQNFFYGGRIMGIQFILVYITYFYMYKINMFNKIPLLIMLIVLFTILGNIRANHNIDKDVLMEIFNKMKRIRFTMDTAYSSYYTSLTFLKCENIFNYRERILLFVEYIKSIFLGNSIVKYGMLQNISKKYYLHYNGGLFPYFFHFYLGWIGVALSGLIISLYIRIVNSIHEKNNDYIKLLAIYFIVSAFRWYLYYPTPIIRGSGFLIVLFFICNKFHIACTKQTIKTQ